MSHDAQVQGFRFWIVPKKILEDALALPEREREALLEALSDSLEPETVELRSIHGEGA